MALNVKSYDIVLSFQMMNNVAVTSMAWAVLRRPTAHTLFGARVIRKTYTMKRCAT
jgi:hypothetical protein